ncbi:SLAM family member 9-like isoform X1 [Acanthopagrus latus]|uniref:SLAM family member 9-like isoform X1 n=1 Tax=Acanthopagrus latus TaxID=8177 RepID=UPI00187BD3A1|nr:SLAM family member 9-like isoform X1 [Acanthopagrus latus]
MGPISLVCTVFLAYLLQGSSAVTPVFVQKGDNLMLNLTEVDDLENSVVFWNFNNKSINKDLMLVRWLPGTEPEVSPSYRGRIEFTVKKYWVKLKNLQETDSGIYTGRVMGVVDEQTTQYKVTVQDPVSPVKLTVDSVSSSSDCNLTVTCSTQDSHISSTFTCDAKTCSQEGGERSGVTTSGASLRVYLVNDSITCNHSNQVSWTKDVTKIQDFCPRHHDPKPHSVITALITLLFLIIIAAAGFFCYVLRRRKQKTVSIDNTVYAVPEVEAAAQPLDPTSNSPSSPSTIYSYVEPHTGPMRPTEDKTKTLPESLYASVEKPSRS